MPPTDTDTSTQTGEGPGNSNSGTTGQGTPPVTGGKTFTQDDVNRIIQERLAEQQRKYEEKANKDRERERETVEAEQERRRLEAEGKYKEAAEKADERARKAEQELANERAAARQRVVKSEIRSVAAELRFADPGDAYRFLDLAAVEVNDDGEPVNVRTLLDALAKEKPYLVKSEQGDRPGLPRTPNGDGARLSEAELAQQNMAAQLRTGRYARF